MFEGGDRFLSSATQPLAPRRLPGSAPMDARTAMRGAIQIPDQSPGLARRHVAALPVAASPTHVAVLPQSLDGGRAVGPQGACYIQLTYPLLNIIINT